MHRPNQPMEGLIMDMYFDELVESIDESIDELDRMESSDEDSEILAMSNDYSEY